MSYIHLSREEMVSVTDSLVDETHEDCRAVHADPLARELAELVAAAHKRLIGTRRTGATENAATIREQLAELGERLGEVLRGLYHGLLAQEYLLAKKPELAEQACELRETLFPEGLRATGKSYHAQAGHARMLEERLSSQDLAFLRRLTSASGEDFTVMLREWFELGNVIGELEDRRKLLSEDTPSAGEVLSARLQWIRAMQAFVTTLRLRPDLPGGIACILDRIEATAEAAARRQARRQGNLPDTDIGEPDTDAGEPADSILVSTEADSASNSNIVVIADASEASDLDATMDEPAGEEPAA